MSNPIFNYRDIPGIDDKVARIREILAALEQEADELPARDPRLQNIYLKISSLNIALGEQLVKARERESYQREYDEANTILSEISQINNSVDLDLIRQLETKVGPLTQEEKVFLDSYWNLINTVYDKHSMVYRSTIDALFIDIHHNERRSDEHAYLINDLNDNLDPQVLDTDQKALEEYQKISEQYDELRKERISLKTKITALEGKETAGTLTDAERAELDSARERVKEISAPIAQYRDRKKELKTEISSLSIDKYGIQKDKLSDAEYYQKITEKIKAERERMKKMYGPTWGQDSTRTAPGATRTPTPTAPGGTTRTPTPTTPGGTRTPAPTTPGGTRTPASTAPTTPAPGSRSSARSTGSYGAPTPPATPAPRATAQPQGPTPSSNGNLPVPSNDGPEILAEINSSPDDLLQIATAGFYADCSNTHFSYIRRDNDGKTRVYRESAQRYVEHPVREYARALRDLSRNNRLMQDMSKSGDILIETFARDLKSPIGRLGMIIDAYHECRNKSGTNGRENTIMRAIGLRSAMTPKIAYDSIYAEPAFNKIFPSSGYKIKYQTKPGKFLRRPTYSLEQPVHTSSADSFKAIKDRFPPVTPKKVTRSSSHYYSKDKDDPSR